MSVLAFCLQVRLGTRKWTYDAAKELKQSVDAARDGLQQRADGYATEFHSQALQEDEWLKKSREITGFHRN